MRVLEDQPEALLNVGIVQLGQVDAEALPVGELAVVLPLT